MIRHSFIFGLAVAALCGLGSSRVMGQEVYSEGSSALIAESAAAVNSAKAEVEKARIAIAEGKQFIAAIPEDSPLMTDVAMVLEAASENWKIAIDSMKGAQESADKIATASSDEIASDYALLAKVNAGVAHSGAKVVQIALLYIEAVSEDRAEALPVMRASLQDALASSSQVQFNYDRVKKIIARKYSK
ncbi:hypothetical protein [Pontiella agarivorans]|uniref:YfdX protein n=1 Tax=Pontiella agarivorans TaxID=3038953 RepID=A0ABU5MZX2_9BACT|nr:hypothetical protein [Pontiella agarivorans]MDZ8119770.1 hypothetical protein [Pontiella agarivorans]